MAKEIERKFLVRGPVWRSGTYTHDEGGPVSKFVEGEGLAGGPSLKIDHDRNHAAWTRRRGHRIKELFGAVHESAIGTKRTYRVALHMSAFGGKADVCNSASLSGFEVVTAQLTCHKYSPAKTSVQRSVSV